MKIRICMVTNMYPTEDNPAYGAFIKSQIDSIVAAGHEVGVLFIDGRVSRWNYVAALRKLRAMLSGNRYDLVHAHYGLSGIIACAQRRCPVVVSFCGDDVLGTSNGRGGTTAASRAVSALGQFAALSAARVIVKSNQMRDRLIFERCRRRAVVIPNGVDFELFHPVPGGAARAELGFTSSGRYVLFPSTPRAAVKRVELARAAVEHARRRFPGLELVVLYEEPQSRVPLYMSACDAMIMTSDSEGSPNVIKEAMACNLPIVSVDAGDAWDVMGKARQCHRAARSAADLGDKLAAVLDAGERSNGRECIRYLELGAVAGRVIEVYQAALVKG